MKTNKPVSAWEERFDKEFPKLMGKHKVHAFPREAFYEIKDFIKQAQREAYERGQGDAKEDIRLNLDSVVNAHLWGDYSLNLKEVRDGCLEILKRLELKGEDTA